MSAPIGGVWAMKRSDYQPTNFASTATGLQAALDYVGGPDGGEVYVAAGTISGITTLTLYAKTTLRGAGPLATLLVRAASATGPTIREKTAGEGNNNGATGINIIGLGVYANGSAGDGINLGNQGGPAFNALASLIDVLARDYTSGTGIKLNSNAIHCRNIWSASNQVGFLLEGGSSHYSGIWAEGNSDTGIRVNSPWNTLVGVHLEDNGVGPTSLIEMAISNNNVFGVSVQLGANGIAKIIREMSSVNNCCYTGINIIAAGHTWTHTIYRESPAAGTGAVVAIPFCADHANSISSIFYDRTTNKQVSIAGPDLTVGNNATVAGTLGVTGASTLTGLLTANGAAAITGDTTISGGNVNLNNSQAIQFKDTGGTYRYAFGAAGGSDNIRIRALAATGAIQFNNFADTNNNLTISDAGAVATRSALTIGNLTSGKYPKISTAGLIIDGPTPLSGTKVYYVSDSSGGAVTRKLTFTDGILTAET